MLGRVLFCYFCYEREMEKEVVRWQDCIGDALLAGFLALSRCVLEIEIGIQEACYLLCLAGI